MSEINDLIDRLEKQIDETLAKLSIQIATGHELDDIANTLNFFRTDETEDELRKKLIEIQSKPRHMRETVDVKGDSFIFKLPQSIEFIPITINIKDITAGCPHNKIIKKDLFTTSYYECAECKAEVTYDEKRLVKNS